MTSDRLAQSGRGLSDEPDRIGFLQGNSQAFPADHARRSTSSPAARSWAAIRLRSRSMCMRAS